MLTTLTGLLDSAPTFTGEFETHITIAPVEGEALARFERTCGELGVKCVRIELARGQTRAQPMTGSHSTGTAQDALAEAIHLGTQIQERGFQIVRVKIEAAPTNFDLPQTNAEANALSCQNYYEHHIKLLLPLTLDLASLTTLAERHRAHLSRNVFKQRDDDQCERFITLRGYGVGLIEATTRVDALLADLDLAGYRVVKTVAEYCFFDSNVQVDAGWLG